MDAECPQGGPLGKGYVLPPPQNGPIASNVYVGLITPSQNVWVSHTTDIVVESRSFVEYNGRHKRNMAKSLTSIPV